MPNLIIDPTQVSGSGDDYDSDSDQDGLQLEQGWDATFDAKRDSGIILKKN